MTDIFEDIELQIECTTDIQGKIHLLNRLAGYSREIGESEQMDSYAQRAYELLTNETAAEVYAQVFIYLATYAIETGRYAKALEYLRKGRSVLNEKEHKTELAEIYAAFGNVYQALTQYGRALEFYFDALRIYEQLQDTDGIRTVCHTIGNAYESLENTRSALTYLHRSLTLHEQLHGTGSAPALYLDIADAHLNAGEYEDALEYYLLAKSSYERLQSFAAIPMILLSIGKLYLERGELETAMNYARDGLSYATAHSNKQAIMNASLVIARILAKQGQLKGALEYLGDVDGIERTLVSKSVRMELTLLRSTIYAEMGEYEQAYRNYREYAELEREHYTAIREKLSRELELQYERERQEHEAELYRLKNIELVEARRAAESANQAKTRFLTTMSHEIRTPINGVIGMAQILAGSELTEEQRDYLGMLIASGNALLHLVNDILDLSKIEAGKMKLAEVYFNLANLLDEVIETVRPLTEEDQIEISQWYPVDVPREFIGDPVRIRQILMNLVGNAVKFTREGCIVISLGAREKTEEMIELEIQVKDTGIGIPEKKQTLIFDDFYQLDSSTTRAYNGTGLGLAITKKLVTLMNGTIEVESTMNVGTTFKVFIPLQVSQKDSGHALQDITEAAKVIGTQRPGSETRILVVEDKQINQKVAEKFLMKLGCSADMAENGREALNKLQTAKYDLVLMDCQMPVMDGYEATRIIRATDGNVINPAIPIVAMTAHALEGDREKCIAAGMDDYIAKPIVLKKLKEILDRWIVRND